MLTLSDNALSRIPPAFGNLNQLVVLDLSRNGKTAALLLLLLLALLYSAYAPLYSNKRQDPNLGMTSRSSGRAVCLRVRFMYDSLDTSRQDGGGCGVPCAMCRHVMRLYSIILVFRTPSYK